jgi:hypothetical protein
MNRKYTEEFQEAARRVMALAHMVAVGRGMGLTDVRVENGARVGCVDTHILTLSVNNHNSSTNILNVEFERLLNGVSSKATVAKIESALECLRFE